MGKFQPDGDSAKVLFTKKSFSSFSRTLSTLSNHTTKTKKSLRRKVSTKGFYTDGGKIKRDLSIETDLCAIRRRFKEQLKQLLNADAKSILSPRSPKSAKSRYSDFTEADQVEEFQRDDSASGDNSFEKTSNKRVRAPFLVNKEHLLYKNFNKLVETWIQQVLKDKDVQTKVKKVFESLTQNQDLPLDKKPSSGTTYVLDKDDCKETKKSKSSGRDSNDNQYSNDENSATIVPTAQTVPLVYDTIRLISTLSIPRNMNRKKIKCKSRRHKIKDKKYRIKTEPHNVWFVTLQMEGSEKSGTSIDLLEYPTTALLQNIASWDKNSFPPKNLKHSPVALQQKLQLHPVLISTKPQEHHPPKKHDSCSFEKEKNILIKSIYNDDDEFKQIIQPKNEHKSGCIKQNCTYKNIVGTHKNKVTNRKDRDTEIISCQAIVEGSTFMHETDQSDHMVTVDYLAQKLEYSDKCPINVSINYNKNDAAIVREIPATQTKLVTNNKPTDNRPNTKLMPRLQLHKEISNRRHRKKKALTRRLEDVIVNSMKYENLPKLDIHVNIFSNNEVSSDTTMSELNKDIKHKDRTCVVGILPEQTYAEGEIKEKDIPILIPLLDGAASQSKYLFKTDSLTKPKIKVDIKLSKDQASMTKELGLKEEFNEIKATLKTITQLVSKVGQIDTIKKTQNSKYIQVSTKTSLLSNKKTKCNGSKVASQGIQMFKGLSSGIKSKKTSGITFKKEGKINSRKDNLTNIEKSSSSYKIIDSESVIQVTDMEKRSGRGKSKYSVALTCSMTEHRSLYEVSSEASSKGNVSKRKTTPFKTVACVQKNIYQPILPKTHLATQASVNKTIREAKVHKTANGKTVPIARNSVHRSVKKVSNHSQQTEIIHKFMNEKSSHIFKQTTESLKPGPNFSNSPSQTEPTVHKPIKRTIKENNNLRSDIEKCGEDTKPVNGSQYKNTFIQESFSTEVMIHNLASDHAVASNHQMQSCNNNKNTERETLYRNKARSVRGKKISGKYSTYSDSVRANKIPYKHSVLITRRLINGSHVVDMPEISSCTSSGSFSKPESRAQKIGRVVLAIFMAINILGMAIYLFTQNNTINEKNEYPRKVTPAALNSLDFMKSLNLTELGF